MVALYRIVHVSQVCLFLQGIVLLLALARKPSLLVSVGLFKNRYRSNYRTYSNKRTLKQFRSLQITASVLFVYFFIKTYVVSTDLNCIDLSMQFKSVLTIYAFMKKIRKKNEHSVKSFSSCFIIYT